MPTTLSPVMPAGTTSTTTPTIIRPTSSATHQPRPAAESATKPPAAPEISPEMSALMLENTKLKREFELKTKEGIVRARKLEGTLANERKTFAEKLKDADWAARIRKEAPINRVAVAKELWGDKWYEALTEAQLSGGAPTAESVQLELEKRDAHFKEELARRDAEAENKAAAQREAAAQHQLQRFTAQVAANVKAAAEELPLTLKTFGDEAGAARAVVNRIQVKWNAARKEDPAAKPMLWKEAADEVEAELYALAEYGAAHPRYAPKLREKLTPGPASGGNAQSKVQQPSGSQLQQSNRKTLSNDLTASTQSTRAPAIDDEERMRRARERYDAVIASRAT